jgi:hypothetical protein
VLVEVPTVREEEDAQEKDAQEEDAVPSRLFDTDKSRSSNWGRITATVNLVTGGHFCIHVAGTSKIRVHLVWLTQLLLYWLTKTHVLRKASFSTWRFSFQFWHAYRRDFFLEYKNNQGP